MLASEPELERRVAGEREVRMWQGTVTVVKSQGDNVWCADLKTAGPGRALGAVADGHLSSSILLHTVWPPRNLKIQLFLHWLTA
jgi:hypothetical protein